MDTLEEAIIQKNMMNAKGHDNTPCCKTCAGKADVQHAHCGKAYIIEKGNLKETSLKHFYDSNTWQLDTLTTHIYNVFHLYFYKHEPEISELLADLAIHPVAGYATFRDLGGLFVNLKNALTAHFLVEENVLFPHIINMVKAQKRSTQLTSTGLRLLNNSVCVMENEHDNIRNMLEEIKTVTNHYTVPSNAPEDFVLLYRKLKELHDSIQQHFYLENNILYPAALLLQKELVKLCLL